MTIYEDYESWRKENLDFLLSLIQSQSKSISRFTHVIAVVDYLAEKYRALEQDLDNDEENIFSMGFDYINDRILTLKMQFEANFKKDIILFNQFGKSLNLLLYINDFQDELLNATGDITKDMQKLDDLENIVLEKLEAHQQVEDGMFVMLNEITETMFETHHLDINLTESIFYEIALYYNIYQEPEEFQLNSTVIGSVKDVS